MPPTNCPVLSALWVVSARNVVRANTNSGTKRDAARHYGIWSWTIQQYPLAGCRMNAMIECHTGKPHKRISDIRMTSSSNRKSKGQSGSYTSKQLQ